MRVMKYHMNWWHELQAILIFRSMLPRQTTLAFVHHPRRPSIALVMHSYPISTTRTSRVQNWLIPLELWCLPSRSNSDIPIKVRPDSGDIIPISLNAPHCGHHTWSVCTCELLLPIIGTFNDDDWILRRVAYVHQSIILNSMNRGVYIKQDPKQTER